ncbi:MAG: hypothetical protein EOO68_10730, partial [Moraxellaceae bacterium]
MLDSLSPQQFITLHGQEKGLNEWHKALDQQQDQALLEGEDIRHIVQLRSKAMDSVLKLLWEQHQLPTHQLALIAV